MARMPQSIIRRKYSEEMTIVAGLVALFIALFFAALYYKPTMIPQALRFGVSNPASGNHQVVRLPHMAMDLKDNRELTLAIHIEVPDTAHKKTMEEQKPKLKITIREIIAEHSSGSLTDGNGRQRLKNDIAYAASRLLPPGTPVNVYISDFQIN